MLKNKNAVITGATRGIGREIAITLAKNGANIAINYRKENEELNSLVNELEELGVDVFTKKCDVSNGEEVDEFIKESKMSLGSIDILVNNAGITKDGLILENERK